MLVLSRRKLESIYLDGGRIEVTVLKLEGNRVRLGITAPPEVSIQREEVHHRVELEERTPTGGDPLPPARPRTGTALCRMPAGAR